MPTMARHGTTHPTPDRTLRRSRSAVAAAAAATAAAALPSDVRLMNAVSAAIFAGTLLALLAAGVLWLTRSPGFSLRAVELSGELQRAGVATVRANALPAVGGNFFSIDLAAARQAFETVPWVRRAVVRRIWPDRLAVQLEEHRALAVWESADAGAPSERLVNSFGEVFDANLGDVEDEDLPTFAGPEGSAAQMLALWRRLAPAFEERGFTLRRLALSGRGSWRAETDRGAVLELGRGSEGEVAERSERFLRTLTQITDRYRAPLLHADLRHQDGYALRLRGVTTAAAAPGKPGTGH